ncbi:MAG: twin-arginine translocase subunit TatC [Nitrospinota bacterium]|nr:twin-arginine translocase subunit TatC [Nitrospinota bacterium]
MTEEIQTTETEDQQSGPVSAAAESGNTHAQKKVVRQVDPEERLPITAHLEELRWRIIYAVATVFILFVPLFALSDYVLMIVMRPLPPAETLHSTAPQAIFFFFMKISLYSAVVVSMPMIIYQAWEFIAPGLLQVERKYTAIVVLSGSFFFVLGTVFCYFLVLPAALAFFQDYAAGAVANIWTIHDYTSFFFTIIIAFGLAFELPIVMVFLLATRVTTYRTLASKRPYAIVGAFVAGALFTPSDPLSQAMLAAPLYLFFEMSLLVGWIFFKPPPEEPKEPLDEPTEG